MKRKFLTVTAVIISVMMLCALVVLTACGKSDEYPTWNISSGDSKIEASFSDNGKYGYVLTIEGEGAMKDFSLHGAPWYDKAGRITEIKISGGVTYIGDNAFTYCYAAMPLMLPASVTKVGKNIVPSGAKIYAYSHVTVADDTIVYEYLETAPTTSGYFWHMVNGKPTEWPYVDLSHKNVLFIGNSYTFYNDMPTIFENIATNAGASVTVEFITTGSQSLINWADPNTDDGARVESALNSNKYDVVVLQEKSTSPINDDYNKFVAGVKALASRIAETQENCRVVLYETWGSPAYASSYGGTIPAMEALLRTAYETVAQDSGATVSYVGKAFTYVYENLSAINLYNADNTHPSYEGSFLAACVHAATIFGLNPENSTYDGTLDVETALLLKKVAYGIVFDEEISVDKKEYDLKIAVWPVSTNFDPDLARQLVSAFQRWCEDNSIQLKGATYTLLQSTKQAEFSAEAEEGDYNIAIGFRANSFKQGTPIKDLKIKGFIGDNKERRIALLDTEDEFAIEFYYNFIESDIAKKILNPDYISEDEANKITINFVVDGAPYGESIVVSNATEAVVQTLPTPDRDEGYVFKGWALSADETDEAKIYNGNATYDTFKDIAESGEITLYAIFEEGEEVVYDLRIAVWYDSSVFDPDLAKQLLEAFGQWCEEKEIELGLTMYEQLLEYTKQADYSKEAVEKGYNIAIGFRANSFSNYGISSDNIKDLTIKGIAAGSERRIALLIDDEFAHEFYYNFIESDIAKKILDPDYDPNPGEEANTITVGYYSSGNNTVSDAQLETIKEAFIAYALEREFVVDDVKFEKYTNMTTMNNDAASGKIDYVINVGNAISSANDVGNTKQQPTGSSRYVMQITDSEIAALFHQFALQDETICSF